MASLAPASDLEERVSELNESLATAMAGLEVVRNRERRWKRENQELRAALREAGVEVEEDCDRALQPLSPKANLSPVRSIKLGTMGSLDLSQEVTGARGKVFDVEEYPVDLITQEGKVSPSQTLLSVLAVQCHFSALISVPSLASEPGHMCISALLGACSTPCLQRVPGIRGAAREGHT